MAKQVGHELNADLLQKLSKGALFRSGGLALPLLTLDEHGWPHVAITAGAVAVNPTEIWLAMGAKTGSLRHVEREGKVTLLVAGPGTLYYVKGIGQIIDREMRSIPQEAVIRISVTDVSHDMQSYLQITGGLTYQYPTMHEDYVKILGALLDELQAYAEGTNHADRGGN